MLFHVDLDLDVDLDRGQIVRKFEVYGYSKDSGKKAMFCKG